MAEAEEARPHLSGSGYQRLRRRVTLATAVVALVPLVVMTVINYVQYEDSLQSETTQGINRLMTNNKRSLEFFLAERRSALRYLILDRGHEELSDSATLGRIMRNMNESFLVGAFVDLGLIDSQGRQLSYDGPYNLQGREYRGQDWFHRVSSRGVYTSDVFLGYRNSPHLVIATRREWHDKDYYILRATVDAEMLGEQLLTPGLGPGDDIFLVNRQGVLQTSSRRYGGVLQKVPFPVPHYASEAQVVETRDETGSPVLLGYAYIAESPFVLMFIKQSDHAGALWLPARLFGFLALSAALILGVILWGSRQFVANIRTANMRRAALMHEVEYNNKLASIGRLAAGVAHEINNPLAIINEKAGLLKDLVQMEVEFPRRDKVLSVIDSVLGSVDRCKRVTHRLLGFAKHMDVQHEPIDLPTLLAEVVGFLGKEAEYRNIRINLDSRDEIPTIESDRGQLQQVFLNLINNSVAAVADGGHIDIVITLADPQTVSVSVGDDGVGIPTENLQRIFEPFFTTREGSGTGLGLSITYGIVKKLGGDITVASEVGAGTRFTVLLPVGGKR